MPVPAKVFRDLWVGKAQRLWDRCRLALGFIDDPQFILHAWRHTFCSRLAQRGVPLLTIQKLARHRSIQMTMRYAHLAPDNLSEAIKVLQQAATPDQKSNGSAGATPRHSQTPEAPVCV